MTTLLNRILGITALLLISHPAFARPEPAKAQFEAKSGSVEFRATGHPSAIKIIGKGAAPQGNFVIEGNQVTGAAKFDLASLDTGIDLRTKHMKEKYLEVAKFPDATLTITQLVLPSSLLESAAFHDVPFAGTLKLHDVVRPITGKVDIAKAAEKMTVNAQFGLRIADYGIAPPSFAGISMADQVEISVRSVADLTRVAETVGKKTSQI